MNMDSYDMTYYFMGSILQILHAKLTFRKAHDKQSRDRISPKVVSQVLEHVRQVVPERDEGLLVILHGPGQVHQVVKVQRVVARRPVREL